MKRQKTKIKIHIKIILAGLIVFTATLPGSARAAEILGVEFNNEVNIEDVTMNLQGLGLKSVVFLKAFVAGFYSAGEADTDQLGLFPKHLEVQYFVSIPAKKLNKYTIERMKKNITKQEFQALNREIDQMAQYFVDLKPGDRFSLTFIPEVGTKFAHNGQETGIIKGENFGKALFSVWVGKEPFDKKLKNQILGLEMASNNNDAIAQRVN